MNRLALVEETAATTLTTQSWARLIAAQDSIGNLAAVLERARSKLGGVSVQAGNHLEMAEMDLLSARDAIEKACWEMDEPTPARVDVRSPEWSASSGPDAPAAGSQVSAVAEPTSRRRTRRPPGRTAPGHGQGELFPLHQANG